MYVVLQYYVGVLSGILIILHVDRVRPKKNMLNFGEEYTALYWPKSGLKGMYILIVALYFCHT